jgi:2-polyprenyl-6-methoxyphenol hydroxylase-like FAD-dependent oxidoreductase
MSGPAAFAGTGNRADTNTHQVIIVGGGPVGLGLAIELGQRGVRVCLVERYAQPQPIPKGQNLTQRTMEHFVHWGCEAELRAARTIPKSYGIGGLTAYGTLLGDYHYDWLQRELVRPYYFTDNERLPQYATEAVLRQRLTALPTVETLYGWQAEDGVQDADGVSVAVVERTGPGRRWLRADYAVGSDGARSIVRDRGGIRQTLSDHDRVMVLLVFRAPELHTLLHRYPGKSYYCVLTPELKGYWQFFGRVDLGTTWFFHAPVPAGTTKDNFDFRSYLHRAVGAEFGVEFEHIGFWDLRFAVADTYRNGRVFIAGDAAHSHPPYGGYGINTGFEDARSLGWKLAATLQGWAGPGLLDSYSLERQPVFASTAADFIEKSIHVDRDFLAAFDPARDKASFEAKWAERQSGAKSEVGSFEPNYEGSPVVCGPSGARCSALGSHTFAARAGHHLAPAPLSDGRDVFEALGDGFTLLAFDSDPDPFAAAAQAVGMPLTVVGDTRDGGRERYGAGLVLVRPDQFVAWAGDRTPDDSVLCRAMGA